MFSFIFLIALGTAVGYMFRNKTGIHRVGTYIHIVVCLLLFLLGLSVGVNQLIMNNLAYFCEQAAVISSLSVLGSMLAAMLLYNYCFKGKAKDEK